jgi:hypothetical protein
MLRVLYEDANETETFDEISLHNMMLSDVYFNKETLQHSAYSWIIADSSRNFQDLEKFFRLNNLNTYLIAKKITVDDNFVLKTPNNNVEDLLYECYFSCKPRDMALQEVLDNCSTYDENFEKLEKSGNLCIIYENNIDVVDNETSLVKKLMNNKIKLIFKKLTPKESIEQMSEDILKTTGNKPIIKIIGKLNDDCPIMAFLLVDGNVASNIAWAIKKENEELIYQLIDLNEHYAKNK